MRKSLHERYKSSRDDHSQVSCRDRHPFPQTNHLRNRLIINYFKCQYKLNEHWISIVQ